MLRFVVQHHAEMPSTMDEARARAADGAPDGTVVVAGRQTQGRGRHGRDWFSPEGNLYASILLRPGLPPARLSELGFVVAVAVADAVDAVLPKGRRGRRTRLKWPNDVLVDGGKIAGILVEIIETNAVIVGIGLNITQAPQAAPYPVTCLRDAGVSPSPEATDVSPSPEATDVSPSPEATDVSTSPEATASTSPQAMLAHLLAALQQHLAQWMAHGFTPLRSAWLARGPAQGDLVRVRIGARIDTGRFAGLDTDGALLLAEDGTLRRVVAGEVVAA